MTVVLAVVLVLCAAVVLLTPTGRRTDNKPRSRGNERKETT